MAMYNAKITWRDSDDETLVPYLTEAKVSAPDELTAKNSIKDEFANHLRGFLAVPDVRVEKIELTLASSNLALVAGYGA